MFEATEQELEKLPVKDDFRLRGMEMTRTETFTDAAFAFALTLLVVSIDAVPSTYDELLLAVQGMPAFGLACLLLFQFWYGHWNWSRRFGLEDFPSILLSFFLVIVMLCFVYPMKYVTELFVTWITGRRLEVEASISSIEELYSIFTIYSFGYVIAALAILMLNLHAWRLRDQLLLNDAERLITRAEIGAWLIISSVGVVAILMGFFAPRHMLTVPGWAYALLGIFMPIWGMTQKRKLKEVLDRDNR